MIAPIIAPTEYVYTARLDREASNPIYDGDSLRLVVVMKSDLGFGIHQTTEHRLGMVRLYGIDAPEMRGSEREQGIKSRDFVRQVLEPLDTFAIQTIKDKKGKYGRYLVKIFLPDGAVLNGVLVENGLADVKEY